MGECHNFIIKNILTIYVKKGYYLSMRQEKASIDFTELETFRMTLPVDHRDEKFRFMRWRWDIVKAQFLIQQTGKEPGVLHVPFAVRWLGLYFPPSHIDPKRAMSDEVDTNIPVILAFVQFAEEQTEPFLIDGWNRLFKANQERKETILYYMLSQDEERLCRISLLD